jgi:hypothetical protein
MTTKSTQLLVGFADIARQPALPLIRSFLAHWRRGKQHQLTPTKHVLYTNKKGLKPVVAPSSSH